MNNTDDQQTLDTIEIVEAELTPEEKEATAARKKRSADAKPLEKEIKLYFSSLTGRKLTGLFYNLIPGVLVFVDVKGKDFINFTQFSCDTSFHYVELSDPDTLKEHLSFFFPDLDLDRPIYFDVTCVNKIIGAVVKGKDEGLKYKEVPNGVDVSSPIKNNDNPPYSPVYRYVNHADLGVVLSNYSQLKNMRYDEEISVPLSTLVDKNGINFYPINYESANNKKQYKFRYPMLPGITCVMLHEFDKKLPGNESGSMTLLVWCDNLGACRVIPRYESSKAIVYSFCPGACWF